MIAYFYDEHGYFTGQAVCPIDAFSGLPMHPDGRYTLTAPMAAGPHQANQYRSATDDWQLVDDYSSAVCYSKANGARVMVERGMSLSAANATLVVPEFEFSVWQGGTWVADLLRYKERAAVVIDRACRATIVGGLVINGYRYSTDLESQANLTAICTSLLFDGAAQQVPFNRTEVVTGKKSRDLHTAAEIVAVGRAVEAHIRSCQSAKDVALKAIQGATTISEIESVSFDTK